MDPSTIVSTPEIARELGVDTIVEGSMVREGNQVRITAELIDARTDHHIWAHTYVRDLTSVLALQGEVAQAIADEISITSNHPSSMCATPAYGRSIRKQKISICRACCA